MRDVERLREAKRRGVPVTADVTPHHLTWTDEALLGFDTLAKVIPPLREAEDRDALRAGLADGTIDCIATDHAPHSDLEKECELEEALPGMIGLIQATETIKLILGAGEPLIGRFLIYDALRMRFRETRLSADPACPVCAPGRAFPGYREMLVACGAG